MRFLRLFRLLRLLKLLRIRYYLNLLEEALNVNLRFIRVLQMIMNMLFMAHLLGCFWYYIAVNSSEEVTWITEHAPDAADPESDLTVRYMYSLYWALTTLTSVGYGDITPANHGERMYTTMALLVGALVFGYVLSDVGTLFASLSRQSSLIDEQKDAVKVRRWSSS
jgi:hypothetical protein